MCCCQRCVSELDDDASYCPECGTAVKNNHEPDTTDRTNLIDGDSWEWLNPRGPFESPRRAVGSLNLLGFVSFLLAIRVTAVGLPITALPHPIPIALFAFWAGVLMVGLPLGESCTSPIMCSDSSNQSNPTVETSADSLLSGGRFYLIHRGGRGHEQGERCASCRRLERRRTGDPRVTIGTSLSRTSCRILQEGRHVVTTPPLRPKMNRVSRRSVTV
jgi:hypothetical protein